MKKMNNFILGFSLSLVGMFFTSKLISFAPQQHTTNTLSDIKIQLFKSTSNILSENSKIQTTTDISTLQIAPTPISKADEVALSLDPNGINDDEILSVNVDALIPIDYNENTSIKSQHAEFIHNEYDDNMQASLPDKLNPSINHKSSLEISADSSNRTKTLEDYPTPNQISAKIETWDYTQDDISYKVAEKIKHSIIFPIPNEILNDENLTPTFIQKKPKQEPKKAETPSTSPQQASTPAHVLSTYPIQNNNTDESAKGILDNLSSWFSSDASNQPQPSRKHTSTAKNIQKPSYSSQDTPNSTVNKPKSQITNISSSDEFVTFYKTLQETNQAYENNKILPSELKLFFQPNRAEISGKTLHWLKLFSEATNENSQYIQIQLDTSSPTDLQKKRLNLLYTIFTNNNADLEKINTILSPIEENTFIIRILPIQ